MLYSFAGGADWAEPSYGPLVCDSAGNLYGTTQGGGAAGGFAGEGVVYKLDATGQETVLYSFPGMADGSYPEAGVIRDSSGNLYGTTNGGGAANAGTVFKVDARGHETVLNSLTGGADGGNPQAGVIRDSSGNLYGTTLWGGTTGQGVVYKLDTTGQETVLYSFTGGPGHPYAGVIQDSAGNLYGTATFGGAGVGVVYKLDTSGQETVLYTFTSGADGGYPYAGVILDSGGNLYGTSEYGGTANAGVVYKVDTTGHQTVLYNFTGGAGGGHPSAGVIRDSTGNLYGTTGNRRAAGAGVAYKVDTTSHYTVLYSFTGGADGRYPEASVIRDSAGNLYETAYSGGKASTGVVFKLCRSDAALMGTLRARRVGCLAEPPAEPPAPPRQCRVSHHESNPIWVSR